MSVEWITIGAQMRFSLISMAIIVVLSVLIGCFNIPMARRTSSPDTCIVSQVNNDKRAGCKFPFIFNGNIYASCSTYGISGNKSWCSTKVNSESIHQDGFWGYCNESCPVTVGVPLNIKSDCPSRLLAKDFELFGLNGIYLVSEFGLLNGRAFYYSQADSNYCIWWEAVSFSWVIGNCSAEGFARFGSTQNCPDKLNGNWMLINFTISSYGSVKEANLIDTHITPTSVEQKIYWKNVNQFDWAALCRFETYETSLVYLKQNDCMMKCSDDESCTHFNWVFFMGGYCVLRRGPVSIENASYVNDFGFTCGIKKRN